MCKERMTWLRNDGLPLLPGLSRVYTQGPSGGGGGGGGVPSYSTDLESALRTELFQGYEVLQRPEKKVTVSVALNMLTINSLVSRSRHYGQNYSRVMKCYRDQKRK